MLTLTTWWTQLHEETCKIAASFPEDVYLKDLVSFDTVQIGELDTPWQAIHNMASLGASLESNISQGMSIGKKIELATQTLKNLKITDEKSLLIKILMYRSQCRYHTIQCKNFLVRQGIQANRPKVDKTIAALKKEIKEFCAFSPKIALAAKAKFESIFHETQGFPSDSSKNTIDHYMDYANDLVSSLVKKAKANSFVQLRLNLLRNTNIIHRELTQIEKNLKSLYLQKELKNYLKQQPIPTATGFIFYLQSKNLEVFEFEDEATRLWDKAQAYVHNHTSYTTQIKQSLSGYSFDLLYQMSDIWAKPFQTLCLYEINQVEQSKKQMDTYLTQQIASLSDNLNQYTLIPSDLLQEASSEEVLKLSTINHAFILEINLLKKSLESYIETIQPQSFGWFSRWFAKMDGRMKYLKLAQEFKKELDKIELHDPNAVEHLKHLKQTVSLRANANQHVLFKNKRLSEHFICMLQSPTLNASPNNKTNS